MQTPQRILQTVRAIGVEGLWEDHAKPELSAVHSLAQALDAETHVRYPSGTGNCDLVVPQYGEAIWVEVKFAKTYQTETKPGIAGVPIRRQLVGNLTGAAVIDVRDKLPTLYRERNVDHVGFLLVAFHSEQLPLRSSEVEQLELAGGLREAPWTRHVEEDWPNPTSPGCQIRAYYWQRPAR
jgi:hypothetical protein